jgi:hypothetical protein
MGRRRRIPDLDRTRAPRETRVDRVRKRRSDDAGPAGPPVVPPQRRARLSREHDSVRGDHGNREVEMEARARQLGYPGHAGRYPPRASSSALRRIAFQDTPSLSSAGTPSSSAVAISTACRMIP